MTENTNEALELKKAADVSLVKLNEETHAIKRIFEQAKKEGKTAPYFELYGRLKRLDTMLFEAEYATEKLIKHRDF